MFDYNQQNESDKNKERNANLRYSWIIMIGSILNSFFPFVTGILIKKIEIRIAVIICTFVLLLGGLL